MAASPEKEGVGLGGGSRVTCVLTCLAPVASRFPPVSGTRRAHSRPLRCTRPRRRSHGNPPASADANMAALGSNPAPSLRLSRRARAHPRPAPPPSASSRLDHAPARRRAESQQATPPRPAHECRRGLPEEATPLVTPIPRFARLTRQSPARSDKTTPLRVTKHPMTTPPKPSPR